MKNPAHPGALIKDDLADIGAFDGGSATGLGITRQQLHNVISGRSAITPDMALRLEIGYRRHSRSLVADAVAYDLAQARLRTGKLTVKRLLRRPPEARCEQIAECPNPAGPQLQL